MDNDRGKHKVTACALCNRQTHLTFHHLIPRKVHARKSTRRRFSSDELAAGIYLCNLCHSTVHRFFTEEQLAREYNTLEKLRGDKRLQKHAEWAARQQVR